MANTAERLAEDQKEISVAEFFERNRQVLGFDSTTKAILTSVKEAVDNALDACEEADSLPDIRVEVNPGEHKDELELIVEDSGPGIVQRNMPNVFARLLYGSRFHAIRQSRGQQGIGISAVVLYSQLTTGTRATATSKTGHGKPAVQMDLTIDTKRNLPEVHSKEVVTWEKDHGTRIRVVMKARYQGGKQSVFEYLRSTSIVNPHARIEFRDPNGTEYLFDRATDEVPKKTEAIKPHPLGTELGTILKMTQATEFQKMSTFLQKEFCSVGAEASKKILKEAEMENIKPTDMTRDQGRKLYDAFTKVKIMAPPTDCLSPIGETLVRRGLKKETEDVSPEYITTVTRPPSVWGGHPFQVEVGVVYGGSLPKEGGVRILRFANRVPLLYQQGACEGTLGISAVDWRRYGLEQRAGKGIPNGPAIILVHVASTKVPFTNEAKEAIAPMEEIHKEIRLALQEAARGLGRHLKKKAKRAKVSEKFTLVSKILPEINKKASSMLNKPEADLAPIVCKIMDVIWIDDSKAEYEKMVGETIAPVVKEVSRIPTEQGLITLGSFEDEDIPEAEEEVVVVAKPKQAFIATATIPITNYRIKKDKFRLYSLLPEGAVVMEADPKPSLQTDKYVAWDLVSLKPAEETEITLKVAGVGKGDMDGLDLYIEGINELYVVGADPWHGGEE
jgi:DNA topoisomerase-6 subunit B